MLGKEIKAFWVTNGADSIADIQKDRKVLHTLGNREALWDTMGRLAGQEQANNKLQIIISVNALSHPVSGQDIAKPGRAREEIANGIEQHKAVYRDGRYQTQVKRNPGQYWVNR